MTLKPLMGCCMWWSAGLPRATSQLSSPTMMLGSTVSKPSLCVCVCVCLFTKVNYTHFALQYPKEHALHDFHLGRPSVSKHLPRVSFPIFTVNKRWLCVSVCTLACVRVQRAALWKWCVWAVIRAVIWMPADCSLSVLLTDCMQCEMKLVSGVRWSQRHIRDGSKTQAQFSFFLSFFVWKV